METKSGFTLIELMVAVALAAILLAIGVPSFYELMQNNRTTLATNDFVAALNLARSEAVKRVAEVRVSACDGNGGCEGSGSDWRQGWVVWFDDAAGTADTLDVTETLDERMKVFPALEGGATFTGTDSTVEFSKGGTADAAECFELSLPDAHSWRRIRVNVTGGVVVDSDVHCP